MHSTKLPPFRFLACLCSRAFTLIELLVVVTIIAILAAIALPNFLEAQTRAKIARAKNDLRSIATAMEAYAVDHRGHYPPDYDSGVYPGITVTNTEILTYAALTTPVAFISTIPADPFWTGPDAYIYYFEYYQIDAVLKRNADSWAYTWVGRSLAWFSYCMGPDSDNDLLAQDQTLAVNRSYDPTNGTVSSGDFGRTNTGPVPR